MKRIIIITFILLFISCFRASKKCVPIVLTKINEKPSVKVKAIENEIQQFLNIQFYYPNRKNGKSEVLFVVLNDSVFFNFAFDLNIKNKITFPNIASKSIVEKELRILKVSIGEFSDSISNIICSLREKGVFSIVKGNNFIAVQTLFFDSTFEDIKKINQNYFDYTYNDKIRLNPDEKYCLGFYCFLDSIDRQKAIKNINESLRSIYCVDSNTYCFRSIIPHLAAAY